MTQESQSSLVVALNLVFHVCTKHIKVHHFYVNKENLSARDMNLTFVPTQDNPVNLFIKALGRENFEAF